LEDNQVRDPKNNIRYQLHSNSSLEDNQEESKMKKVHVRQNSNSSLEDNQAFRERTIRDFTRNSNSSLEDNQAMPVTVLMLPALIIQIPHWKIIKSHIKRYLIVQQILFKFLIGR